MPLSDRAMGQSQKNSEGSSDQIINTLNFLTSAPKACLTTVG
jgi:hypothetical protein